MRIRVLKIGIILMSATVLSGCGKPQDTDVTSSPDYNFKSFAGTVWKTKVKMALADLKRYTGRHDTAILPPRSFDPKDPNYKPAVDMKVLTELPIGTRVRIERLMKDNGQAGLLWVTATLDDGKVVYLSDYLLAKNRFVWEGWSDSKEWGVDPELLEKAD